MKIFRKILLYSILALSCAALGAIIQKEKFFPYYHVVRTFDEVKAGIKSVKVLRETYFFMGDTYKGTRRKPADVMRPVAVSPSKPEPVKPAGNKPAFEIAEREIPSALLPLLLTGVRLDAKFNLTKRAGGMAVAGEKVVVADKKAKFFIYDSKAKTARNAEYPLLPSNREAFYKWGRYGRNPYFRVHDIGYAEIEGKGYLLASHEMFDTKLQRTRLAVHRLQVDPVSLAPSGTWEKVFESTPLPVHDIYNALGAGGRLFVDGDSILLTIGDYNQDGAFIQLEGPFPSQDKASDFGWIIRLNILTGERENISYGHRNPQGLTISQKGEIFSTEHGPRGGDELNRIRPGQNYGWPLVTLGMDYPHYSWPFNKSQGRHDKFEAPVFSWVPSIAVSNLIEAQDFHERWNGDLLVGSLKASTLYRLRLNKGKIIYAEPIWIGERIRDLEQLPNGTIVMWTDQAHLLFLTVDKNQLVGNRFGGIPSVSAKLAACLKCHHLGGTNPTHAAPSLKNIIDRPVASDISYKKYTSALKQVGGIWTRDRLTTFLAGPSKFAPGTNMAIEPITSPAIILGILDELERAK